MASTLLFMAPIVSFGAPYAYINNFNPGSVSVIDIANNAVVATIPTGNYENDLVVNDAATQVFVSYSNSNDPVNVTGYIGTIDTSTNALVGTPIDVNFVINDLAINAVGADRKLIHF